MKEPERLFDLLDRRRELAPERPVFANKKNGKWEEHKIEEYIEKSTLLSYAFMHLGVQRGENVALISAGRPEWNYVDMGVQMMGAVLLPIYPTISESEYLYILTHAEVRYIIVEGENLYKKIDLHQRLDRYAQRGAACTPRDIAECARNQRLAWQDLDKSAQLDAALPYL